MDCTKHCYLQVVEPSHETEYTRWDVEPGVDNSADAVLIIMTRCVMLTSALSSQSEQQSFDGIVLLDWNLWEHRGD